MKLNICLCSHMIVMNKNLDATTCNCIVTQFNFQGEQLMSILGLSKIPPQIQCLDCQILG
jgi:hypothetical protein